MTAQELKNSILQLAIQGKLVKQDPNDEPASILLKKIKEEREKLIKEKKIKKEKYSEIYKDSSDNHYYEKFEDGTIIDITEEIPFDIPNSWCWCRFNNVVNYRMGKTPPRSEKTYWNNGYKWVSIADMKDSQVIFETKEEISEKGFRDKFASIVSPKGTLIMSFKLTVGRVSILGMDALHNEAIISIFPYYDIENIFRNYLFKILPIISNFGETKGAIKGRTLNSESLNKLFIPLPPINEQTCIINKIDKLLPLINKYNNFSIKLDILNNSYKDELKKSILQYAIQGKLVPQNSNDEPSEILINRILDEKRELIKAKKIKKENLSVIYKDNTYNQFYEKFDDGTIINITDEIPFDIPDNWKWCRLNTISYLITKGSSPSWQGVKYVEKSKESILFVTSENVGKNEIIQNNLKYLEKKFNDIQPRSILKKDDILTNIVGASIGRSCIYNLDEKNANINQAVCLIRLVKAYMNKYILQYLNSPFCYKQMLNNTVETARPNISLTTVGNLFIPLPPENEQEKILIKLEELNKILTAE